MRIGIISFTQTGCKTAQRISKFMEKSGNLVTQTVKCAGIPSSYAGTLKEWTKEQFEVQDAVLYIGAAGIAVRAIAPYVVSKKEDPAVLVIDEQGHYCIPILSGHIGGGNELALQICEGIGAVPVITTATDINGKWAVDVFATKNHLHISDMKKAKAVSAAILRGQKIQVWIDSEISVEGIVPAELNVHRIACIDRMQSWEPGQDSDVPDIYIGTQQISERRNVLQLVPGTMILGIGCRKGTEEAKIEALTEEVLMEHHICREAVSAVASIDLKADEAGLCAFCRQHQLPFVTYSAEQLLAVEGDFTESAFVRQVTGVANVCERSARCAGGERIVVKKTAKDGVTVAVAVKNWEVKF